MPKFSIIIPYKDVPSHPDQWMIECLESLERQTFRDFEVIWVGDFPRDSCPHQGGYQWVYLRGGEDPRIADRVNRGVSASTGEFVIIFNANDTLDPQYLELADQALTADPTADYWVPNGTGIGEEIMHNSVMCGVFALRRSVWDQLGGMEQSPEGLTGAEDWHLWMKIWCAGIKGITEMRSLYIWRRHEGSTADRFVGHPMRHAKTEWMVKTATGYRR